LPGPPPQVQGRQGALHGRGDGALLPGERGRAGGGGLGGSLAPVAGGRGGGGAVLPRVRRFGGPLQLRLRPGRPGALARGRPDRADHRGRHRPRLPALRLPARRRAVQVRLRRGADRRAAHHAGAGLVTRVALLSVHTCPLAALGGKETGGMNVYVRELARELGRGGVAVDVFTRSQDPAIPEVVDLGPGARVVHVAAGPASPLPRGALLGHLDAFVEGVEGFRRREGLDCALPHSHYWLSGVAALELRRRWGRPVIQMFHTLAALKNAVARSEAERESEERLAAERRLAISADRLVAANPVERAQLAR